MSNLMIPGPEPVEPNASAGRYSQQQGDGGYADREPQQRAKTKIPTADDCLRAMAQLAGLVVLGLLKPSEANAMRAIYAEILRHHKAQVQDASRGISDTSVMDLLAKNPEMLNLLEPLLTDEQVAMVMAQSQGSADGQV